MNIKEFIEYIITFDNVDDIIDNCKNQSMKGFIFERLFDVIVKFGFCPLFNKSDYIHLLGNVNNGKLKVLNTLEQYLNENVISGKTSGCSDITLKNINDNSYIFISSKYYNNDDINVDDFDIQKIIAMVNKNKYIYQDYKIYLLVNNKDLVLEKVKNSDLSSCYITDYILEENIFDKNDLNEYFLNFKEDIIENLFEDWQSIYFKEKENLTLRFHQLMITQKTSDLIEEGNKSFLYGCKCRSGKSYLIAGLILNQFKIKNKLNILIITPAPNETIPQFTDDLFFKFKEFDEFNIHYIKNNIMINKIKIEGNKNIFIMSKQLLQRYINDKTILEIKNLNLDLITFDEVHFSGTTDLSKDILNSYSTKNTVRIYLTATYYKPLKEWDITTECQMYWDLEDEQICKSILENNENLIKLKDKHNSYYIDKTINQLNLSLNDIFKPYLKMPDLYLITNLFDQQRYERIKESLEKSNSKMGFCFDSLFYLNKTKTRFKYINEIKLFLRYISGCNKEEDGDKTIMTRINNICFNNNSRIPFTQLWFLPSININEISLCLRELMLEDPILTNYDIICINSNNKDLVKDIKNDITKKEIEAKGKGKLGLIILAANMLTLGITLNKCDLVILMNNCLSSDKVLQQMYRCMTESSDKKFGFVVDLNISRVLNTCINYTIHKHEETINNKLKYLIERHLINIDVDLMLNKKLNSDYLINKLMNIWKEDPINNFKLLLKKLDNDYEEFDNSTQRLINKTFINSIKDNKISLTLRLKDENDEIDNDKIDNENDNIPNISFTKDVLPYVIPLTCILTIKDSNLDFVKMLNDIKETPELLDTFNDQCLIWWNKKDLIDLIKEIVDKHFNKNSNTYNVSIQFKMSIQSLIDKPKELLELINECLKPKIIEKKQFGEVFTPMCLVNEMLDKLPIEVWHNKDLTWFDPATGMGNYPIAIYLRLMESLKDEIENEYLRKKHILENMIYMSELNKKNVLICRQIFDINNEFKLNLYNGDSLKLDIYKEFNIKQFDIIVGNPPFQESDIKTKKTKGGTNLYNKFINFSFNNLKSNGYINFITPISWLGPSTNKQTGDDILHNIFLKYDVLYLNINECKKYFNVGSTFSYYIIRKSINDIIITKIISQYNKLIELSELNLKVYKHLLFLPIHITKETLNLVNNVINNDNKLNIERCRKLDTSSKYGKLHLKLKKDNIFKYITYHTTTKTFYSDIKLDIFNDTKILLNMSGYLNPKIYNNCNITESKFYIKQNYIDNNLLIEFLNSKFIKKYLELCKYSGFNSRIVIENISYNKDFKELS